MTTQQQHTPATSIDPATNVGFVSLTVADLERSVAYYTTALGFTVLDRSDGAVTLGVAGTPLLMLVERPGAKPWPHDQYGYTGLYHFAILLPQRADLGRWLRHWLELGYALPGQGDHLVSEALYLSDPDGHGIEIYRDRPRDEWTRVNGQIQMASDPVDIRGLLDDAARSGEPWRGFPAGTRVGHIHLQAGDIAQARAFYHDVLGFDVIAAMPSALFISAGGYHHHIGLNTWHSKGAPPAPADTASLGFYTVDLPSEEARAVVVARLDAAGIAHADAADAIAVRDPFGNTLLLRVGATPDAAAASALAAALG